MIQFFIMKLIYELHGKNLGFLQFTEVMHKKSKASVKKLCFFRLILYLLYRDVRHRPVRDSQQTLRARHRSA